MTPKPTPGPWWLSDETERDGLRSRLLHGMPEGMLAIIRVEHQGRYYGDANARLIAAAPELFDLVLQYRDDLIRPPSPDSRERRLEAIDAALSKATPSLHEGERG